MPRPLYAALDGLGRAVDVVSGHLMQCAMIPSTPEASSTEVIRALGHRLTEKWKGTEGSPRLPARVRELLWPMPIRQLASAAPPPEVHPARGPFDQYRDWRTVVARRR